MEKDSTFTFLIDHIDPLGQGVYKENEKVYFIPKTLPGESGRAKVVKAIKSLYFCELVSLDKKSPERIDPECVHFTQCNGCHFLHTSRDTELIFKEASFQRMLNIFEIPRIQILQDANRLNYRNRIQLHYNKKYNLLGFHKYKSKHITSVAKCKILKPTLQATFNDLQSNWKSISKKGQGHIEIYDTGSKILTSADKAYAAGGFSQVNSQANEVMLGEVEKITNNIETTYVVDLFAGNGNISNRVNYQKRICVDIYDKPQVNDFLSIDLFKSNGLEEFKNIYNFPSTDLLIIDPPRSGFKELKHWINFLNPKRLLYISCHPQTMIRDLSTLSTCKFDQVYLIDLFPATYHFEAMCLIDLSKA